MSKHWKYLELAAVASRLKADDRRYYLGAVGVRADGTHVYACNGAPKEPERKHHCEYRLCRKLDRGSVVYIARTLANGSWALARPCMDCTKALKGRRVAKVYYTIDAGEWGCMVM